MKSVQRRTRDTFVVVLLIPILMGAATFWLERKSDADLTWVSHSQEVLRVANRIVERAYQAESNQRGYLVTADPSFLGRYGSYTAEEGSELQRFDRLTADNPLQQHNAAKLLAVWK